MVATSPAATSAVAPAEQGTSPEGVDAVDGTLNAHASASAAVVSHEAPETPPAMARDADPSFPAFVALIQSGPRRTSGRLADREAPSPASRSGVKPTRRSLGRAPLHPAWLDAIPAAIDELQGAPAPIESELEGAVREAITLGVRHTAPRFALPRGHWPWWAWATYASTIGVGTVAGLYATAFARLALPAGQPLWVYRTRRGAANFLLASTALTAATTAAFALVPPVGRTEIVAARVEQSFPRPLPPFATVDADRPTASDGDAPVSPRSPSLPLSGSETVPDTVTPMALTSIEAAAVSITISPTLPEPVPNLDAPAVEAPREAQPAEATPPPATPKASPTTINRAIVANTGGRGVAFRNTASWDDRVTPKVAVRDGTSLMVTESGISGDDGAGGTTAWVRVRDSSGRTGYVPARFVQAP